MLYLDVMRWCWQQDFRTRPSAKQLEEVLSNPSIPYLIDAISLHNSNNVTCACVSTLPIEIVAPPSEQDLSESILASVAASSSHSYLAQGDLQEELWLATHHSEKGSEITVINFKGKASQVKKIIKRLGGGASINGSYLSIENCKKIWASDLNLVCCA